MATCVCVHTRVRAVGLQVSLFAYMKIMPVGTGVYFYVYVCAHTCVCTCICLMCAYLSKSSAKCMHSENYAPVFEYVQGYISVASSVLTHVSLCVCLRGGVSSVCMCLCEPKCLHMHVESIHVS